MRNSELEKLIRRQYDHFVRIAWLVTGNPGQAADAVAGAFQGLQRKRQSDDLVARQAVLKASLRLNAADAAGWLSASHASDIQPGSPELAVLAAIEWAGLSVRQTSHHAKVGRSKVASLHSSARERAQSLYGDNGSQSALRMVEELAAGLPRQPLARRSALLDELWAAGEGEGPRRWPYILAGLTTVSGITTALAFAFWPQSQSVEEDSRPMSNIKPPQSVKKIEDLTEWTKTTCRSPGGDYLEMQASSITGRLQGQARLTFSSPLTAIDDRMVSLLLLSPTQDLARFCFARTDSKDADFVDWYVMDLRPEDFEAGLLLRPVGANYITAFGSEDRSPFGGGSGKPDVDCPDAQVTAVTLSEVGTTGGSLWQIACGIAPVPDSGSVDVTATDLAGSTFKYPLEDFEEVPISQTVAVAP